MTGQTIKQLNEAVAAETERCAQVCAKLFDLRADQRARHVAAMCADAIRSSAKKEPACAADGLDACFFFLHEGLRDMFDGMTKDPNVKVVFSSTFPPYKSLPE
jgi:hypothetical protein